MLADETLIETLVYKSIESKKIQNSTSIKEIKKLAGDGSSRTYWRVFTDKNSFIVCMDKPTIGFDRNKFVQVQGFLNQIQVRVPSIHDYQRGYGYLLEEDLGDATMLQVLSRCTSLQEEFTIYKRAIDLLLEIQSVDLKTEYASGLFDEKFDHQKLFSEINHTIEFFIKRMLLKGEDKYSEEIKIIQKYYSDICHELASKPMVLSHRDFHSRNIMCHGEDFVLIDFQDARQGLLQYDLVSLLEDCYYQVNPKIKKKLINYYSKNFMKNFPDSWDKDFERTYDLMTLQRVFKAVGSFAYISLERNNHQYSRYIGYCMEKIRQILIKFPNLSLLQQSIFKIYYEN